MKTQVLAVAVLISGCSNMSLERDTDQSRIEVEKTERAFAKTMADRDFAAFKLFLSEDAIFFTETKPLRGKGQIEATWEKYYKSSAAPFSWEPADVQVVDSGSLALSTGPVRDATGKCIATYNSIWRKERSGAWRIVFDKGSDGCESRNEH